MWPLKIRIPKPPWLSSKESSCNAGDVEDSSSIPGSGRSPRGGNGNLLQYSCLENPMDRGAWQATVHRVARSQIQLSDWVHTHSHRHTHTHMPKLAYLNWYTHLSPWSLITRLQTMGPEHPLLPELELLFGAVLRENAEKQPILLPPSHVSLLTKNGIAQLRHPP